MSDESTEIEQRDVVDTPPPPVLFRFRQFPSLRNLRDERLEDAKRQRDQVFQILKGQLRLAKPDTFNDPFEFRPAVLVRGGTAAERDRDHRRYVRAAARDNLSFKKRIKLVENPAQIDRVAARLPDITAQSFRKMRNEIELYCVSANQTRPLLWSHYADGHRGVALHFSTRTPPLSLAWKVEYTRVYPTIIAGGERSRDENWRRLQTSLLV